MSEYIVFNRNLVHNTNGSEIVHLKSPGERKQLTAPFMENVLSMFYHA